MIALPDRLDGLMKRIEQGETVTREDVDRIALLQAFDLARAGQLFADEANRRDFEAIEDLRQL